MTARFLHGMNTGFSLTLSPTKESSTKGSGPLEQINKVKLP